MNFLWPSSWFSGWLPCLQQRVETRGSPRSFRTPAVLWMYDSITTWTHILISTFTGKKVYQDRSPPVNTAGYIRKQICTHSQESLHQELITKRSEAGVVPPHIMPSWIRYNFGFKVCSLGSGRTIYTFAHNLWPATWSPFPASPSWSSRILKLLYLLGLCRDLPAS